MCGFAGIISPSPATRALVHRMIATLPHRGPDGDGTVVDGRAALAHRRLSIVDVAGGHQPMRSQDGTITVVFNGEIYNYPDLRIELERDGCRFQSRCDTEVLLHLYAREGRELVERLDGMFAFAIWDSRSQRLLMARDHVGQKPLFFLHPGTTFAFASEVKALLASGLVPARPDTEALYHYMSMRYIPHDRTLIRGIHKLEAGHTLVLENGEASIERYWDFRFSDSLQEDEHQLLNHLDEQLRHTIRSHLMSDVPVGSFLSGGIDSSLITAIAAQESGEKLSTFAVGVREASFNELPWAREVATRWGTDHHEQVVSADLVRLLPDMVWHMDEPADPFSVGIFLASELAAGHVKVVLSGDGGDELFAGYDRFAGQRLAAKFALLPRGLREKVLRPAIEAFPESFGYNAFSQKIRWLNDMSLAQGADRYAESLSYLRFPEGTKDRLFVRQCLGPARKLDSRALVAEWFTRSGTEDEVHRMLYTDLHTRVPDHLLTVVDRMSMAHGLEVRPPLLEHRMVEFAASIPSAWKLRGGTLKYLLRRLAARYVPPDIVHRPKQGFAFPISYWLQDELGPVLDRSIGESRFVEERIFDRGVLDEMADEHRRGSRNHNYRLWMLLNLEIWYRLFIDGASKSEVRDWIVGTA